MQKQITRLSKGLNLNKQDKSKIIMSHRGRTWQNPNSDAINSKLKVLSQNFSNRVGSVCYFDGSPITVGSARTPKF